MKIALAGRPLIVGASGQVGQQISRLLSDRSPIVTTRTPPGPRWIAFDLASAALRPDEASRLLDEEQPDAVYCVGGATDVEGCERQPEVTWLVNQRGPAVLAQSAAHRKLPFLYFSTEYVFDGEQGPYRENDRPRALSVYGKSKLEGESSVLECHPGALVLRTTVVYGSDSAKKNFLYSLRSRLSNGFTMRVAEDQISTPTYNRDLARAAIGMLAAGASGIYHVCGPELLSRYRFATIAAEILGLDASLIVPTRTVELNQKAPRPLHAGLSTDKLRERFPQFSMQPVADGIRCFTESIPPPQC